MEKTTATRRGRVAHGGKTVYGARVGILMLDTLFPRIPGDMCNALTWPFPVLFKVVRGASAARVAERSEGMREDFMAAGEELVGEGADGITTNCGFLAPYQDELAKRCGVPVAASSLMQIPFIECLLPPGRRAGVVTVSSVTLDADHLEAAGARPDTPVAGTENGTEFHRFIRENDVEMDVAAAEQDILDAGHDLVGRHPEVGAVVLECTNMTPYARALSEALALPVYSIYSFVCWFHAGLAPRDFGHSGSGPGDWRER
jgi:hypothetical protein